MHAPLCHWDDGRERWPVPGEDAAIAAHPHRGDPAWVLAGWALNVGGVQVFCAHDWDPVTVRAHAQRLLGATPYALRRRCRRIDVVPWDPVPPRLRIGGHTAPWCGLAEMGEGRVTIAADALADWSAFVTWHELAHLAGSGDGGPPVALRADWERAQREDAAHARAWAGRVCLPESRFACTLGGIGITVNADEGGIVEDWADAVALWLLDAAAQGLAPTDADRLLRFDDIAPARARLCAHWAATLEPADRADAHPIHQAV